MESPSSQPGPLPGPSSPPPSPLGPPSVEPSQASVLPGPPSPPPSPLGPPSVEPSQASALPGPPSPLPPPQQPEWPTPPGRPAQLYKPYLAVRSGADRRLVIGAVAGGVIFDIVVRSGFAAVAGTAWVSVVAAALLLGGRIRGRASRMLIGAAPALGLTLMFRSSPWVIAPVTFAIVLLLLIGVSLGADGSGLSWTFPALGVRFAIALGHLAFAGGMFRLSGDPAAGGVVRQRSVAVVRGVLLGMPVVLVVGLLLASADPIFRSWFNLTAVLQHLVLASIGAWIVVGLIRAASAEQPAPSLPSAPSLGTVEAACVLGGLCALYAAFVGTQFVALSGGGSHVLLTHGLTYAQYARSGFFQLLACAAITLGVLLSVRACARSSRPVLTCLYGLTIALTIGVVVVAIRRLQLYEAAFGLTMLRLACIAVAVWIGLVFVLLGLTLPRRGLGLPGRLFPAAVLLSGLLLVAIWSGSNPAAIVARTDLRRAEHGKHLDIGQAASLGPDALPTLVADLGYLDAPQRAELRHAICARSPGRDAGLAFCVSIARSNQALARECGPPGAG
jgi:hypothetical protein